MADAARREVALEEVGFRKPERFVLVARLGYEVDHAVVHLERAVHLARDLWLHHVFCTVKPPSTGIAVPVMNDAPGNTNDHTMCATSSGSP